MQRKLVSIALIAVLLCLSLGSIIACTSTTTYTLTMASTAGGTVTPALGTHTYAAGTIVSLTATPGTGYQFDNWTGDTATIPDDEDPTTTITMNADYSITANFAQRQYDLIVTSTDGGEVTAPTEGTHTYDGGEVVNLVATPDTDYHFVSWTGDVADIEDAYNATTTITMNDDYSVTANFGFDMAFVDEVPDTNQPPTQTLLSTQADPTNFCAPIAMANVLEYWDDVMSHANAQEVTAGLPPETVAEYLGWFMDTNNNGDPDRANAGSKGTNWLDITPGTIEYVRWDATHNYPASPPPPAPALPAGKLGYDWGVIHTCDTDYNVTLNLFKSEIDSGRPLVVTFDYWNPVDKSIAVVDPETGETINVFVWGGLTYDSLPPAPPEHWTYSDVGHAVTGVGYKLAWDPDGAGPIPLADWVIVHDNWSTTPENVAIPWVNWMCLYLVTP